MVEPISRNLEKLVRNIPHEIGRALYQEAQIERTESMKRTPVDTGNLKGSHDVTRPRYEGRDISVSIVVGGTSAPYAIYVHENLEAFHRHGQAKFLESTVMESRPFMAQRVAKRIDLRKCF